MSASAGEASRAPVFKKRAKGTFKRKRDSEDECESPPRSVSDILKHRRQVRTRRHNTTSATEPGHGTGTREIEMAPAAAVEQTEAEKMAARFVPQTGQIMDTYDKQLNAYVEAKMAEYRGVSVSATTAPPSTVPPGESAQTDREVRNRPPDKQAATAGKLMEIELPAGQSSHRAPSPPREKLPRMRVGRDGKLFRPKPRKRRNSADLARDQAVEGILQETPLSLFGGKGAHTPEEGGDGVGAGGDAQEEPAQQDEEEVFERFRREWRDAPERRPKRPPASTAGRAGKAGKTQREPKGPRMGGSKNARRQAHEEKKKNKKKK